MFFPCCPHYVFSIERLSCLPSCSSYTRSEVLRYFVPGAHLGQLNPSLCRRLNDPQAIRRITAAFSPQRGVRFDRLQAVIPGLPFLVDDAVEVLPWRSYRRRCRIGSEDACIAAMGCRSVFCFFQEAFFVRQSVRGVAHFRGFFVRSGCPFSASWVFFRRLTHAAQCRMTFTLTVIGETRVGIIPNIVGISLVYSLEIIFGHGFVHRVDIFVFFSRAVSFVGAGRTELLT